MRRIVETAFPSRFGTGFRWYVGQSWASNLGDGIALAAGPLLVASQTDDALLVAMATALQRLPWLLFGLHAGVLADRLDRRRIVIVVNLLRCLVVAGLATTILTGSVSIWVVLGTVFLLGTAETFADTTTSTLLPMIVPKADLGIANARLLTGIITLNQLAGPPVGAMLFALGLVWPFLAQLGCLLLAVVLLAQVALPSHGTAKSERSHVRRDIADGVRWLWRNAAVRTLAITIVTFNVTYGAAWSVLVLYTDERLGLGPVGFGLFTTFIAVGGIIGTASYGWLSRRLRLGTIMRVGLLIETFTHLALALTTLPWVAMTVALVFGAHAFVWGTTSTAVRQRAVPTEFQGRVSSVYLMGVMGGLVGGAAIGGVIAQRWGVVAAFWFAFVGSAVLVVVVWRQLSHIAHADEEILAAEASGPPA